MASSASPGDQDAARALGLRLTGTEAGQLADRLTKGYTLTSAVRAVPSGRRAEVGALLRDTAPASRIAVLRAIEGARSTPSAATPLWTTPGHLARSGPLTTSLPHLVDRARQSVTCSTFNFQRTSGLWNALRGAARRPGVAVRVYIDTSAAEQSAPTAHDIAAHLSPAVVLRTTVFDGRMTRNHAKFLVVDHRFLLVTSANLSWSAENGNVEFGVLLDDRNLAEAVERQVRDLEDDLFEVVR
ncbi:phospholipase [Actinoalloteichus sp. AHMU CJ021]|uniref:DISARM system phospholipase D-like protein DrmC n=1 Tax=Actinoalloteichus TaxID=65496 RepID=UPI00036A878B|nr:DISARM system phospholipase D-like protein DrmC [Actinoalloteichus spitiensis]AUS81097.1 phospholipase [Actinoalloteichus sp. AHMU CJ021]